MKPWVLAAVVLAACGGSGGGGKRFDLSMPKDGGSGDDIGTPRDFAAVMDFATPPDDLATPPGNQPIGGPCAANLDCIEGKVPVCWKATVFNTMAGQAVPGGYCSAKCASDLDCGANGECVDFGLSGKWCLAICAGPNDCRGQGYACYLAYFLNAQNDLCFPASNLTCDPTGAGGACTSGGKPGGCERWAVGAGKTGFCHELCDVGVGTCPDSNGEPQLCQVADYRWDFQTGQANGDKFVGPICIYSPANQGQLSLVGDECLWMDGNHYYNVCVDDAECYLQGKSPINMGFSASGDNICKQLCYLPGGAALGNQPPPCPQGTTCRDVFGLANAASARLKVGFCM
jgi:hypothetical protein